MRVKEHILASSTLAVIFYCFTHSQLGAIAVLLSGIFIDLDHLFDFWITRPANPFSVKEFTHPCKYMRENRKVYVFLHDYELIILLWILAWRFNWHPIIFGIAAGATLHLILDDIGNELITFSYFFIYRAYKKFAVFTENKLD